MTRVALIGAGLMGAGLSRLFQRAGFEVSAFDLNRDALSKLRGARHGVDMADAVKGADLVIEAVAERLEVKQAVFAQLTAVADPGAILATNSSVISVTQIAAGESDASAARILGMHFWNPPDVIPLVEVIPGARTSDAAMDAGMEILVRAGKEPVRVRRDVVPGNRLQHALWREALALVDEGICSPADVDHIIKRSFALRLPVLGPFENMDLVGLSLVEQIHQVVLPTLNRDTIPSAGLGERLSTARGGIQDGEGFYAGWTPDRVAALRERLTAHLAKVVSAAPDT